MKRKQREFTAEFKAEAVRLYQQGNRSVNQVSRDIDVAESSLRTWINNANKRNAQATSEEPQQTQQTEDIIALHKKIKRLEMERDILKKAVAFFARESE